MDHKLFVFRECAKVAICVTYEGLARLQSAGAKPIRVRHAATLMCLLALSACGEPDTDVVARASHDFRGKFELFSYRAKPADELGQAEAMAKKTFGQLVSKIKSPSTIFMCLWRNPSRRKLGDGRPAEIFLSCSFAPTPVENPKSLVEMARIYNTIDRANLKANWEFKNGNYRLSRFEVEIRADQKGYRSQNLAVDMPQIKVVQSEMSFPQNSDDPFQFNLQSQLPSRGNSGDAQRDLIVSVSFSGMAEPIPDWVNY